MEKYSSVLILTFFVVLLAFAVLKTVPPKPVGEGNIPVIPNLEYPITSIANPECQYNPADLYIIQPKLFQKVSSSFKILGQATGSFENNIVLALEDEATKKVLLEESMVVEPNYPCTFSKEWAVGTFEPGAYVFKAYFTSPKDGSVVKQVTVPIRIE